jgi:hypothetical protein
MAQTNEYLVELYNWIQSKDSSFIDRFTFDQFENRLDTDLDYQTNLYQWIAEKDKTFVERHPIERWTHRVKKKKRISRRSFFWRSGAYGYRGRHFLFGFFRSNSISNHRS